MGAGDLERLHPEHVSRDLSRPLRANGWIFASQDVRHRCRRECREWMWLAGSGLGLLPELRERPFRPPAVVATVEARRRNVDVRPVRAPELVTLGAAEGCGEGLGEELRNRSPNPGNERAEIDVQARLDQRYDDTAERMPDDDGVSLRTDDVDEPREIGRWVVGRESRCDDLVSARAELAGEPVPAPPSVPGSVDETERCDGA